MLNIQNITNNNKKQAMECLEYGVTHLYARFVHGERSVECAYAKRSFSRRHREWIDVCLDTN